MKRRRGSGPPKHPRPVLTPQAGYPKGGFRGSFDPKMGRGYAIGDQIVVMPGETVTLVNHGLQDHYFRWKVTLHAQPVAGVAYDANTAYFLTVNMTVRAENDDIDRETQVALGRGQVLYAPGRAIKVLATNNTDHPIVAHYSLDEATPGLSAWTTSESLVTDAAVEFPLEVAAFATTLLVLGLSGGANWRLRGYDDAGTLAYEETLPMPRSASIPVAPGLYYTLQPTSAGTHQCTVVYQCVG